jgi:hypothetical protein
MIETECLPSPANTLRGTTLHLASTKSMNGTFVS